MSNIPGLAKYLILPLLRISLVFALAVMVVVSLQDILVLPGAATGLIMRLKGETFPDPPPNVESIPVTSFDGHQVTVWRLSSPQEDTAPKKILLLFDGNAASLRGSLELLKLLAPEGYTSYVQQYRGFGDDEGWPSETKLVNDASAVMSMVLTREQVEPSQVTVLGRSFGTGLAAYLASRFHVHALALLSPYRSIPTVAETRGVLSYLSPFLWYQMPTEFYLTRASDKTCLALFHGELDSIIPVAETEALSAKLAKRERTQSFIYPEARHNNIASYALSDLKEFYATCGYTPPQSKDH